MSESLSDQGTPARRLVRKIGFRQTIEARGPNLVVAVTLLALIVGIGLPAVLGASESPGKASIVANHSTNSEGTKIDVIAQAFPTNASMVVKFDSLFGVSGKTDGSGRFWGSFNVAESTSHGTHTVSGTANNVSASTTVNLAPVASTAVATLRTASTATATPKAVSTKTATPKAASTSTATPKAGSTITATPKAVSSTTATPKALTTSTPSATVLTSVTVTPTVGPLPPAGSTYYVSKTGNNADGRSWATAWNELNQINWTVIKPGFTIFVDGGSSRMVYTTMLAPAASGTSSAPISIKRAPTAGHNGQVAIFGGRSTPLPYCYQTPYTYQTAGVVARGIDFSGVSWVFVDGGKWSGISIYGHNLNGIGLGNTSSNITIRNVEIYDNGEALLETNPTNSHYNTWFSDQPGIALSGTNNTVDRTLIHDNGQDSFQSNGGIANFTLSLSWLSNQRTHPSGADIPWNYCRHSDGIQVWNGGIQSGLAIDHSVLGPGMMQGLILGQSGATFAQLDNVHLTNDLFIQDFNASIMGYSGTNPQNWVIDHVSSYINPNSNKSILGGYNWFVTLPGGGHRITNNVVLSGGVGVTGTTSSGNCSWQLLSGTLGGMTADPMMAVPAGNPPTIAGSIGADYKVGSGSPCAGLGSSITSVAQLLAQ